MARTALLLCALLAAGPALGHDIWVEAEGERLTLLFGHERGPDGAPERLPYSREALLSAACFDADGRERPAPPSDTAPVTLPGPCAATRFELSTGYWSKTPQGTRRLPRDQARQVLDSWHAVESLKQLSRWGDGLAHPLGTGLEVVPLDNPLAVKPGGSVHLAVCLDRRPLAGVKVALFDEPRGSTGTDGAFSLRIERPGRQLIQATYSRAIDDPAAARRLETATLQFDVAP